MTLTWFKKWSWVYLPIHPIGYLISLFAILFLIPVYGAIFRNGHSVSNDLYNMFVYTTSTLFGGSGLQKKQVRYEPETFFMERTWQ